jgi:hypothetical protein
MPFYSTSGPNFLPSRPNLNLVTILPVESISNSISSGTVFQLTEAITAQIDDINQDTTVTQQSIISQNTQSTVQIPTDVLTTVNVINENNNSVLDPIYTKILDVFQALSNPDNMVANNYSTTVVPLLDVLDAEIAQYPDISLIITKIQEAFKRITGILSNIPPGTDSSYIQNYVIKQLGNLDKLIANIPTS